MDAMQITEYAQALYRTHGDRAEIEAEAFGTLSLTPRP